MTGAVRFNPNTGIAGVTTPQPEEMSMPLRDRGLSPALTTEKSHPGFEIYAGRNMDSIIDAALRPQCANPDLMRPDVFRRTLQKGLEKLKTATGNKELEDLVDGIVQNDDLLRTYETLVISG